MFILQADDFDEINFSQPPRGILIIDEDVVVTKSSKQDGDLVGDVALIVQGGSQRWKLCSGTPGEIDRWEEVSAKVPPGVCWTWPLVSTCLV